MTWRCQPPEGAALEVVYLVRSALVDRETVLTRLATVDERYSGAAERAGSWLRSLETGN